MGTQNKNQYIIYLKRHILFKFSFIFMNSQQILTFEDVIKVKLKY
jgi:hypothetical protein